MPQQSYPFISQSQRGIPTRVYRTIGTLLHRGGGLLLVCIGMSLAAGIYVTTRIVAAFNSWTQHGWQPAEPVALMAVLRRMRHHTSSITGRMFGGESGAGGVVRVGGTTAQGLAEFGRHLFAIDSHFTRSVIGEYRTGRDHLIYLWSDWGWEG